MLVSKYSDTFNEMYEFSFLKCPCLSLISSPPKCIYSVDWLLICILMDFFHINVSNVIQCRF